MCTPGDMMLIGEGPITGPSIWGQVMGKLASAGAGGRFLGNILAGAQAGNTDWVAHAKSESVRLEFESGTVVTMNAADMDSAVLAAYGYSYNSVDGIMSNRSIFGDTTSLPSGPQWTLRDGVLTRPSTTSVTGEVLGNVALEIPSGALALAGSASLLTNHAFDGLGPSAPDLRLATGETWMKGGFVDDFGNSWTTLNLVSGTGELIESRGWRTDEFPVSSKATVATPPGQGAASGTSSSYANELAEEHARNYSASVAQADMAQQSEYTANQATKDAASWARIDQSMSQSGAANASGGGQGPAVGAAPGYGPGNVLASGQPGPGTGGGGGATADGSGGGEGAGPGQSQGGYAAPDYRPIIPMRPDWRQEPIDPTATGIDRQGTFKDGRWVPNYFKAVNQDLWTAWGKSSGAEAVLTFPFVLAMSGAVSLPQAVNDIPNIHTLLIVAMNDLAYGNYAQALEGAGDAFGAIGMAGELAGGVAALRGVSASGEIVSTGGTAMSPRVKFRQNPPGTPPRNLEQAKQIAEKFGIDVDPERYLFVENSSLPSNVGAAYQGMGKVEPGQIVEWKRFLNRDKQVIVHINPNIYGSDDLIIGTFAHEIHELELLEAKFAESGGRLVGSNVRRMIDNDLHPAAWTHADELVEALQESGGWAWP